MKFYCNNILKILLIIFSIIAIGIVGEIYCLIVEQSYTGILSINFNTIKENFNYIRSSIIFLISLVIYIINYFSNKNNWNLSYKIYKYRFLIAIIIFIICVLLKINGSSIGYWEKILYRQNESQIIAGISRQIRADEWCVTTPAIFSQEKNSYQYTSNFFQNTEREMFTLIGAPVKDISIIFRIFQIGYVLFGSDIGLSFAWCGRFIALFLATFEFAMLITNSNKKLSLLAAILVSFSPTIQWWYGGLIDMIVAGEVGIILLDKYLKEQRFKFKILQLTGIFIALGNYILTMYPPWIIALFYCFLPILIWVIYINRDNINFSKKDFLVIIILGIIFAVLLARIGFKAKDTIISTLNTVYPGNRTDNGRGNLLSYFKFATNSLLMYIGVHVTNMQFIGNCCEMASMIDFWPLLLIFLITYFKKEKGNKKDFLIKISLCFSLFLNIYYICGFPDFLSKITLMNYATGNRTFAIMGLLNIFILIRLMSIYDIDLKEKKVKILTVIFALITVIISEYLFIYIEKNILVNIINDEMIRNIFMIKVIKVCTVMAVFILLIYVLVYYTLLTYKKNLNYLILATSILMIFSTGLANPIRIGGIDCIEKIPVVEAINDTNNKEDGVWVTLDMPIHNIPILAGVKTISCTQFFPKMEVWEKIDVNKSYQDIYNRYAHITITLDEKDEKFELISGDLIRINLTIKELEKLNVKYILCGNEFEKEKYNDLKLEELYKDEYYKIYKIVN